VPAAVLCTEPFRATAEAISAARGLAGYRFVVLEHPIGSLVDTALRQRAGVAAKQVAELLTKNG
jgi:hypothetical protein